MDTSMHGPSVDAADGATVPAPSAVGSVVWVVPGPLVQATGGFLYDARMINELAALGWEVGVLNVGARSWPLDPLGAGVLVNALGQRSWNAVVFDELAYPVMAVGVPWLRLAELTPDTALIGLVHHLGASEPVPAARRWLVRATERSALARLDRIVCTSAYTVGTVRGLLGSGAVVDVVPPGFDTQTLDYAELDQRERPTGEAGHLRVLMVAHWTPRKGILTALRAVAQAPPGVTLDLVGDQTRNPAYARRVIATLRHPSLAGRVRVHGVISTERLSALYSEADAFLLTSSHEGYGMVLAEALRAGLPIVATRVGAVPDLLDADAGAELVTARDVAVVSRALRRLADDPAERARRAALATSRGQMLPTWRESALRFDQILRQAIHGHAASEHHGGSEDRSDSGGIVVRP